MDQAGQSPKRKKLFVYAHQLGLTRPERIEFAEIILRRDITSWSQLDDGQVDRMLDALEGGICLVELARQRSGTDEGEDRVVAELDD